MTNLRKHAWFEPALVLLLFLVALAVRTYHLREIPPGLYHDEAANGLDVLNILKGHFPIFFERNNGREPLFIYLQAIFVYFLGATPYALRLTAAVVGAATVPATYWMVREAFSKRVSAPRWLAGWTALFIAFSYWHISLSRIGLRAIMLPLLATLAFVFFWRAWWRLEENAKFPWTNLILCGVFVAASLYAYSAARFVPLLVLTIAVVGVLGAGSPTTSARQVALAVTVVGISAFLLFAPLGFYYLSHPDYFFGRTLFVSVLNTSPTNEHPLKMLAGSALQTAEMLIVRPDPNLRHNPAGRPVFDVIMFVWLVGGGIVAARRWRVLPYFFALAWFVILALPAILTVEGVPHSLRAIGMIPAAYLLVMLAMLVVRQWLAPRAQLIALWLPLPFLLFSGFTGIRDYFKAGMDPAVLRDAFQVEFTEIAARMRSIGQRDAVWILPVFTNYYIADGTYATFEFLVQGNTGLRSMPVDESLTPQRLSEATTGKRLAYLLLPQEMPQIPSAPYVFGDPKHLLEFLLGKYGRFDRTNDSEQIGMAYATWELPAAAQYPVHAGLTPVNLSFNDQIKLTGVAYGHTALDLQEPASALNEKRVPAGHALWAVLRWQPQTPVGIDLKVSLYLKDETGHLAGQVDDLLVGDRYPVVRTWDTGEPASTYHILRVLPAIPPGRYGLYAKVYESETGKNYPVVAHDGTGQGMEALLGYVDITRSTARSEVQPAYPLPPNTAMGADLDLLGYDLPGKQVRPGDSLPLTLYWQARVKPARDYLVSAELRNREGLVVAKNQGRPAYGEYPTNEWQAGEILREWRDVPISGTVPTGTYSLTVGISDGQTTIGMINLGNVEVEGRRREYQPPDLTQPISATFGSNLALLGIVGPAEIQIAPGQAYTITLAWRVLAPSEQQLIRFVHLLGPDGRPVAQTDSVPCEGDCPSTSWLADEVLVDQIRMVIPPDLAPGTYPLAVGWYDATTLQRIPTAGDPEQAMTRDLLILPVNLQVKPAHP